MLEFKHTILSHSYWFNFHLDLVLDYLKMLYIHVRYIHVPLLLLFNSYCFGAHDFFACVCL